MKDNKELASMDISGLNSELLEAKKKHLALQFSKNPEAKKYRKYVAQVSTAITTLNNRK